MPYSELLIKPMREDLTKLGVEETRTPDAVDAAIRETDGVVMVIVNSVCGCAAGKARPGVALALKNQAVPNKSITVFAGADIDATEHARGYFKGYAPSSPSIGLLKNGELVYILERHQIEGREAPQIAQMLTDAFNRFCSTSQGAGAD
ncbi:MAG: BrxA/BrxB family bacilliredoxin [Blastocatellia bacterium AA13]|nr:MAG: BrxA/BrxB family bacilliredoxin [Blastocatellia bacterium AA13]